MSEGLVPIILKKTYQVHLKPRGEVCNRLSKGTKVFSLKEKDKKVKDESEITKEENKQEENLES